MGSGLSNPEIGKLEGALSTTSNPSPGSTQKQEEAQFGSCGDVVAGLGVQVLLRQSKVQSRGLVEPAPKSNGDFWATLIAFGIATQRASAVATQLPLGSEIQ